MWDRKRILLVDFMPYCSIVNSDTYCKTLQKLWCAILNNWCGILAQEIVLNHDNAHHNTAVACNISQPLTNSIWSLAIQSTPYNYYHLFEHLKSFLGGQLLHYNKWKVKEAVLLCRSNHRWELYMTNIFCSMMKCFKTDRKVVLDVYFLQQKDVL